MAGFFRTCRDGHRCEYGSTCVEAPNEEGSFFCDCSTATGDFAGLFCEYEAENYCRFPQEVTSSWFCTNRGTCVLASGSDSADWRCDCPDNYDGPHCEFIAGALPSDWPGADAVAGGTPKKEEDGLAVGVTITIVLVVAIVVGLLGYLFVSKRRGDSGKTDQNAPKDHSEALNLEVDGSVLVEAVNSMKSSQSEDRVDFEAPGISVEAGDTRPLHMNGNGSRASNGGHGRII
eukprot:CAMPEP_0117001034 /NCGR_PEP_ID=MMETSP0472-20121206/3172_1 /TAXON_ID=693140 ORGANISM="Tiarina fusus, Strain LIS" /NCGR_SAMPLE_ID=MMETSP0472 /ASSEMBLY_ACC=CAM_ASM_000603 /LENGTH=231 /DNA_ID=CAMNT_0004700915 /DNA_START=105 /DNA_END=801 /DNA_ORIENTATION=-